MPKYNEYPEALELSDEDVFLILDAETNTTKQIKAINIKNYFSSTATAASSPWSPSDINPFIWLDPNDDSKITLDSNNCFSRINDKLGSINNFVQNTASLRPLAGEFNNKRILVFDGIDDFIRTEVQVNFGSNVDFYFVVKYSNSNRIGLFDSAPGSPYVLRNYGINTFEWWPNSPSLNINSAINEFEIILFRYQFINNQRSIAISLNGNALNTASSSSTSSAAWKFLTIGSINTNAAMFNGAVASFILAPNLNASDTDKMFGYLAHNFQLTSKLPSNHPYKNSPPTL